MNQSYPPLTMLSGAFTPSESLHAIGRSLEFLSSATFAMWVHCDEELKDHGEGLQYLLSHLTVLQIHASQLCDSQVRQLTSNGKMLEQQLAQYKELCGLYQRKVSEYEQQSPAHETVDSATVAKVDEQIKLMEQTLKNARNRAN